MNILTQNPKGNCFLSKLSTKLGKTFKGSVTDCIQENCLSYFTGLFMTSSGKGWKSLRYSKSYWERGGKILILFNICSLNILFCEIVNWIHFSIHYNDISSLILGIFTALYLLYLSLLWNQSNLFFHRCQRNTPSSFRKKAILDQHK